MPPRVKNAAATREALLEAARRRFLDESYDNVGLRDIARDAGVDVALVGRYFGSKEELFHEVLRGSKGDWLDPSVDAEALPAFLAALAVRKGDHHRSEDVDRLLIILRSASSPRASEVVRTTFREDVLDPLARLLPGPHAELRAGTALGILTGMTVLRTVMGVEPLCGCGAAQLEARLVPLLTRALLD